MPISRRKASRQDQIAKMNAEMAGTGRYIFENKTSGDLMLPKKSLCGRKTIAKGDKFEGDSYFFKLVPRELKYIKEIEHMPSKQPEVLLTEQPPVYTEQGHVEYVKQSDDEPLHEGQAKAQPGRTKLLNEPASGGVKIIR